MCGLKNSFLGNSVSLKKVKIFMLSYVTNYSGLKKLIEKIEMVSLSMMFT